MLLRLPCLALATLSISASSFSLTSPSDKRIFGVPNSGWKSLQWNWGYSDGTGHDCAMICRERLSKVDARQEYVKNLLDGDEALTDIEEIKLTLALTWQRGRWAGSNGGPNGYGQVLAHMAEGNRYEGNGEAGILRLMGDMQERFCLLKPSPQAQAEMKSLLELYSTEQAFRKCCGLVLMQMGFIENGC